MKTKEPFMAADILLPKKNIDMEKWAVIACDQYTSEPEYWNTVAEFVGDAPSTLDIIVPEVYLEESNVSERIQKVNAKISEYLAGNIFDEHRDSVIYIERMQLNGKIRKGIIGMVDLEEYSFAKDSQSLIRATEGTILERIPPRVRVRENSRLELPHIMLLIDDPEQEIIDNIKPDKASKVYDFALMTNAIRARADKEPLQNAGHVKGYKLSQDQTEKIRQGFLRLQDKNLFNEKYGLHDRKPLLFAVGDGNHSLATAKTCYENLKKQLPQNEYQTHPARYALVEVVNLHSNALEFEPIHRVMFEVDPLDVLKELKKYYQITTASKADSNNKVQKIECVYGDKEISLVITNPKSNLAVGSLQLFIDDYLAKHGGKVDYIHGDDTTKKLGSQNKSIGFLLPTINKSDFFETIILDGALPRKTFSMGHSDDKRFYLEARKIKN